MREGQSLGVLAITIVYPMMRLESSGIPRDTRNRVYCSNIFRKMTLSLLLPPWNGIYSLILLLVRNR